MYYLKGKEHFENKQYQEALDSFRKSLHEDPSHLELNHLIGRAAYETGDFEEALFAYERALVLDPKFTQSRLEKARTLIALGSHDEAKNELLKVLAANIPPEVRANVELLLSAMVEKKNHHFSGAVVLAYTFDSNATLGTDTGIPSPFGPTFPEADPSEENDQIFAVTAVLNHKYPLPQKGLTLKNGLITYFSDNHELNSNDLLLVMLSSGVNYLCGRHSLDFSIAWNYLELNNARYQNNWRFNFKHAIPITQRQMITSTYNFTQRHHFPTLGATLDNNSGFIHGISLAWLMNETPKRSWSLNSSWRYDNSPRDSNPDLAYHRSDISLRFNQIITNCLSLSAKAGYRMDWYTRTHLIYTDRTRHDKAYFTSLGLAFNFLKRCTINTVLEYINNHSNIPTNEYDSVKCINSWATTF